MKKKEPVWGLVILALLLRLLFVFGYPQYPPFLGDDAGYDNVAWNLANGRGFVADIISPEGTVTYEPLIANGPTYPLFLAAVYRVFGHAITAVRVVQAILGAVTIFFVFRIAQRAFGERVACLSAALVAVHPALTFYTGMLLSETVFTFLNSEVL